MKKIELFFTAILVPLDLAMLVLAAVTAYFLRFEIFAEIRPIIFDLPFAQYLKAALTVALIWLVIFALNGLYRVQGPRRIVYEFSRVFVACSTGMMVLIIWIFFRRELFSSRFILLAAWVLSFIFVWLGRVVIKSVRLVLLKNGIGVRQVVVIGQEKNAQVIMDEIRRNTTLGLQAAENIPIKDSDLIFRLDEIIADRQIDDLILADPHAPRPLILELIDWAASNQVGFKYAADLFDTAAANVEVTAIAGIPVVEFQKTRLEGWGRIYKRIFDIAASLILIILTLPIMIATAAAIKLDSKGQILWRRFEEDNRPVTRIGQYGKPFHYFKFRSMIPGAHSLRYGELAGQDLRRGSPLVKIKDDPRITRVGKFIRRYSIDELPELFLVLAGKMSLVGPRPHFPEEVAKYKKQHRRAFAIKPGITGLAQISGRSDLDFEDEVKLDVFYMENWSLLMDIAILLKTPWAAIKNRNAV